MEWNVEQSLKLIELFKDRSILWDLSSPQFKFSKKKVEYWKEIATELNTNANEVKKKMESLLASYRRERDSGVKPSEADSDEIYNSKWFAFLLMQFLNDKFKPRPTKDTAFTLISTYLITNMYTINNNNINQ